MSEDPSTAGRLELICDFVNTHDVGEGTDAIATPQALAAWLDERGLPAGRPTASDVERARTLREGLRALLMAHNGAAVAPEAIRACNAAAARAPLAVVVGDDGRVTLQPRADGVDAALGRLLAIVERAEAEGSWRRLKVCAADDCHWAYYDRSRNRSRTWCDMAVCGNRAKARAYRARKP